MPINIQPSQTLLGTLAAGLGGLTTGYAAGYAKQAPVLQRAGEAGGQAKLSAMQGLTDTFSRSYNNAYNQSFGMLSSMAEQERAQTYRTQIQTQAHQNALEQLGVENFALANRAYMAKTGVPLTDIPDPQSGQVVPGLSSMYTRAAQTGEIDPAQVSMAQFASDFLPQQVARQKMVAAGMEERFAESPDENKVLQAKYDGIVQKINNLRSAQPEFFEDNGLPTPEGASVIAQMRGQLPQKNWYRKMPSPQQSIESMVVPIKNPDGSLAGHAYDRRAVGFTPFKPPTAAGKTATGFPGAPAQEMPPPSEGGVSGALLDQVSGKNIWDAAQRGGDPVEADRQSKIRWDNGVPWVVNAKGEWSIDANWTRLETARMNRDTKAATEQTKKVEKDQDDRLKYWTDSRNLKLSALLQTLNPEDDDYSARFDRAYAESAVFANERVAARDQARGTTAKTEPIGTERVLPDGTRVRKITETDWEEVQ